MQIYEELNFYCSELRVSCIFFMFFHLSGMFVLNIYEYEIKLIISRELYI